MDSVRSVAPAGLEEWAGGHFRIVLKMSVCGCRS